MLGVIAAVLDPSPLSCPVNEISDDLPMLTAVSVVCRECQAGGGDMLTHVEKLIDGYLDTFSTQESVLLTTCSSGASLRALEYLYYRSSEGSRRMTIHVAAMAGHVHVLQWLAANHRANFVGLREGCLSLIDRAAQHGHLDAAMWLHANCIEGYSSATLSLAAQCGHIKVLRWLYHHGSVACTPEAMVGAAVHNKLKTVKWLHWHGRQEDAHAAILKASEHGHVSVVAWLYLHGSRPDAVQAMLVAARCGQLIVMKWLHKNARELTLGDHFHNLRAAVQLAASQDHTRVVVWLLKRPHCLEHDRHNKRKCGDNNREQESVLDWNELETDKECEYNSPTGEVALLRTVNKIEMSLFARDHDRLESRLLTLQLHPGVHPMLPNKCTSSSKNVSRACGDAPRSQAAIWPE